MLSLKFKKYALSAVALAEERKFMAGTAGDDKLTGTAAGDIIAGFDGNDSLDGGDGDDALFGGIGNDVLNGGNGADTIAGGAGADMLKGGRGIDLADYGDELTGAVISLDGSLKAAGSALGDMLVEFENISGSEQGNDRLSGDQGVNYLYGNGGDDQLFGRGNDDVLIGGDGKDRLDGGIGNDTLVGGAGADAMIGGAGTDTANYYSGGAATVLLSGNVGNAGAAAGDTLIGIEVVTGSNTGDDRLAGDSKSNTLYGNGGNDTLLGLDGNDALIGGAGKDSFNGGKGIDTVSYYSDSAVSLALDGSIEGTGFANGDRFVSIETVSGSNQGNDRISGSAAANTLYGNGGDDVLRGAAGDDVLIGGLGKDTLQGGAGSDRFYFFNANEGGDKISGFDMTDLVLLEGSAFGVGNFSGAATEDLFTISRTNHASSRDDRLIFNTTTDTLWFDPDGSGSKHAIEIARIEGVINFNVPFVYFV